MSAPVHKGVRPTNNAKGELSLAPSVVLVPLLNLGLAGDMLGLAAHLTRSREAGDGLEEHDGGARIVVLSVVEVPADEPLTMGMDMARSYRALLDFLPSGVDAGDGENVRVDRVVKVGRDVAGAIRQAAEEERADLILMYWKGHAREPKRHSYGRIMDSILQDPPCSVMLARMEGWNRSRRVVLPVRGGPTAEQALDLGVGLAERLGLPVTVVHNVPRTPTVPNLEKEARGLSQVEALGEEPYIAFNAHLRRVQEQAAVRVESLLTRVDDPVESVLGEVRRDDIVIMGLPAVKKRNGHEDGDGDEEALEGSLGLRVSKEKGPPLLLLNTPTMINLAAYSKGVNGHGSRGGMGNGRRWVDMPFEHWFVEHTYHGDEFRDPGEFLKAKEASGLTLSVAVLTSNDAGRIHSVITGLRKVLQEMHPIAEQIVVVDAGSSDGTPEMARELGAEVHLAAEILPEYGDLHGRGESWWKSLAVAKGDIVVWLDPRARRFHPSTAMSLAGPLLRVPVLRLVKGFAGGDERRRAAEEFSPVDMSWGGFVVPRREGEVAHPQVRVQALKPSDLEALSGSQMGMLPPRTIFQVLCPALAGVIAPFGRDMAARREAMTAMQVFAGENLEVGLLLSVAAEFGTNTIAQVELGEGRPAAGPEPGLREAIDLLQAMSRRLTDGEMRRSAERIAERLQKELEGKRVGASALFEVRALGPVERPGMREVEGRRSGIRH